MAALALALTVLVASTEALLTYSNDDFLTVDRNVPSTKGTDFYVVFFAVNDLTMIQSKPTYQIFISTDEMEAVTVKVSLNNNLPAHMREGFPLTASVSYRDTVTVTFHESMAVRSSDAGANLIEQSKAIHVQTEDGKKVTIQGFSGNSETSDGFIALPCDSMRNEVFTQYEYFVLSAGRNLTKDNQPKNSFALIIPCNNGTDITVESSPSVNLSGLENLPSQPFLLHTGLRASNSATTFTASAGQTFLITHPNDLSGTIVTSSNPIVLLSGHECGEIPLNATACGYMVEQMPPGLTLGTNFLLVPLAGSVSGDLFRVGTLTDGTQVRVTCVTSSDDIPERFTLENGGIIDRGSYITFMTPGKTKRQLHWKPHYCSLDSTEPVIVAQYSTGYSFSDQIVNRENTANRDPFMSLVPPTAQYLNNYTLISSIRVSDSISLRYLSLSIASEFFNNSVTDRQKIRLNNRALKPVGGWVPMYCSNMEICGYGATIKVPRGEIRVYHENKDVGVGISYYAYQQHSSYGIPLGYELTPISATRIILDDIEVSEGVGTVQINISRFGDLSLDSEAIFTSRLTTPVQADSSDYVELASVYVVFSGESTRQDLVTLSIEIIDDDKPETHCESFEIVGVPTKNIYFPNPVMTVTIIDDDNEEDIIMHFDHTSYTVAEGDSVEMLLQKISSTEESVVAVLFTEEGTASALDFQTVPEQVVIFAPNETEQTFTITTTEDGVVETPEQFSVVISSTFDTVNTSNETVNVTIVDNGQVEIGFLPHSYRVNEAVGEVTLSIVKRTLTSVAVALKITTQDGSATAFTDYSSLTQLIVFEPNEVVKEVDVGVIQDSVSEGEEVFMATLVVEDGGGVDVSIEGHGVATITIEDDDIAVVQFVKTGYTVSEGDGMAEVCLWMDGQIADDAVVRIVATSITAEAGLDYVTEILNIVNFQPPGDSVVCTTIEIIDDLLALENEEMLVLDLTVLEGQVTLGGNRKSTVKIQDNDVLMMKLTNADLTVSDGECTVEICLTKNMDTAGTLVVDLFLTEFSTDAGVDLRTINATITFSPLDREACTLVIVTDHDNVGLPDGFMVDISSDDTDISVPPITITINDYESDGGITGICDIPETLTISPFGTNDSYQFEGSCDHYLLRLCDGLNDMSVVVDFVSDTLDGARVGLQYDDSSVVSTETGDLVIRNLTLIEVKENTEFYTNGIIIYRESGINRIVVQATGNITIIHNYAGDNRSIQVRYLSFGRTDTDVPTPVSVCGLCGNIDGTLLYSDLLTVADQEQLALFIDSYTVEASEQFLRGQRRKCSTVTNDTVTGDPVFTVPLRGGGALCYDVHGQPGTFLNLVSDKCTSVNADYQPMDIAENGNIIRAIGIKAIDSSGHCRNIAVQSSDPIATLVDGFEISGVFVSDGIRVRTYSDRVRVSVPNCDLIDLVMWVTREVTNGQAMLRFQISRGNNLAPTSHGLIGQFWNVPVSIEPYSGPIKKGYEVANVTYHLITVTHATSSRTFLGELFDIPWDRRAGSCYYAGDSDGGRSASSDEYDSVIEGRYTEYQVAGLFEYDFKYCQFEQDHCAID